ncbi:MAG: DNA polymerase III subunit beta [Deltaproteobacteria bacterium]|nr:DNA polymerase III subunit beta [Deltaproteobacteria bacterium]
MELTIDKEQFLRGLARTHGVADRKSSMHILSNVLLTAEGPDRLRLSATDLYLGVTAVVPANIKKGGTIAVAARTLFDIVKNLPAGEVSWELSDSHAVELKCGKVRYRIPAMPGEDFPPLPNPGDADFAHLDAARLAQLIALTQYSMSHDDTRPHLAGTLFEGDGKVVRMVTTDGHRLSKAEQKVGGKGSMMNFSMLVPHKGISELKRLLDDIKAGKGKDAPTIGIATSGGNAFFQRDDLCLSVKLADENFPPYNKVIPSKQSRTVIAARGPLVEALRRISLVANDKSGGVQLMITPGVLRLQSQNPEVGEGSEEVDVDYAGDELKIGFNARYLLDALSAMTHDEVAIELSGERDPGVLKPVGDNSEFIGVIMPMRI